MENGAKYVYIRGLNELFSRKEMLKSLWLVQQKQQPMLFSLISPIKRNVVISFLRRLLIQLGLKLLPPISSPS